MDQVPMPALLPDDLSHLAQRQVSARVRRYVYMRQSACPVLNDNKHVQHPERGSDSHEEVARENHLRMVLQEGGPALISTW